jgi:lysosomal-trafficking regulator
MEMPTAEAVNGKIDWHCNTVTGIVLHLLVRVPPFTREFIKFQDGNFDLADRSFHSLATSWQMVSHVSTSDVKELIPQLFYLPEMLENREGFALGRRQNGKVII